MLKALAGLPAWVRPLLWLGAVGVAMRWLLAGIAVWTGVRTAPWWWNALGLPTGEEEDDDTGSDDENGDDADPEEENGDNGDGVHGGNGGGGQVPFDSGLVAVGAATLGAKLRQQAASDALSRSQSK